MKKDAYLSKCRKYRYSLLREWDNNGKTCVFIGLNPSTADEENDDPTLRRCIKFAKDWGYGKLIMVNLFAYRATNPLELKKVVDSIGNENDKILLESCLNADLVIAAWGNNGSLNNRNIYVKDLLNNHITLKCLKITKTGNPSHPLYLPLLSIPINF